jgi:Protein of unknown function (DUF2934)
VLLVSLDPPPCGGKYLLRPVPVKKTIAAVSCRIRGAPEVSAMANRTANPAVSAAAKPQASPASSPATTGAPGSKPNSLLASSMAPAPADLRRAMIAEAAYFIAQQRGFAQGSEVEDWLVAERQIDALLSA